MARDPFVPTPFPPFDGTEPLDRYKARMDRDYQRQRAEWLRSGPLGTAVDREGNHLYAINDRGQWKRTKRIRTATRRRVLERDGHSCVMCGSDRDLELDHVVRYIDGGSDEADNLQTLCAPCHRKKGGR